MDTHAATELRADPDTVAKRPEGLQHVLVDQPGAAQRDGEAVLPSRWRELLAPRGVALQRLDGACMNGDLSGFVEFRQADLKHAGGPVEIVVVEADRFADPEAGRGE